MELWDLYNEKRESTGQTHVRGQEIPSGLYHLVVHVWIRNSRGEYLISQRSADRPTFPLMWECVGGSALAGENSLAAALRETKEEVGIDLDPARGMLAHSTVRKEFNGKRFADILDVWVFEYDGDADLNAATTREVAQTRWMSRAGIGALLDRGDLVHTLGYFFTEIEGNITLELLSDRNIEQARAIQRNDIGESFVDGVDAMMELTQYGIDHHCKGHTYLIKQDGTCIGLILLGEAFAWDTDPEEMRGVPFYRLMGFVIDRRYRSGGIGGYVLEKVIKLIYNEFGIRPIALGVHKDNTGAERFYLNHGFRKTDVMEGNDYYYLRYPTIQIDKSLRLRRFDGRYDFALAWYQDPEIVRLVDGVSEPYTYEKLTNMYRYLNSKGELYFIEVREAGEWKPIGDVTFWQEDMPIVIGDARYRGRGIGRRVVSALVARGRELGYDRLYVGEIYDYNTASQRCFESVGFRAYEQTAHGWRYVLELTKP